MSRGKSKRILAATALVFAGFTSIAVSDTSAVAHATPSTPRITATAEDSTVNLGDEVFLYGDGYNVPRGTKFLIQHRVGSGSWSTVGKSWLGVKVGHHYRVFTPPTESAGTNYYRVKIPSRPHRPAAISKTVAVEVS